MKSTNYGKMYDESPVAKNDQVTMNDLIDHPLRLKFDN